jgi:hypothetical protein
MDYPGLGEALLGQVDDSFYYAASRTSCKHHARLSLVRLRQKLGGDYRLADVRQRLRCRQCGSRDMTLGYFTPAQRVGCTVDQFDDTPK